MLFRSTRKNSDSVTLTSSISSLHTPHSYSHDTNKRSPVARSAPSSHPSTSSSSNSSSTPLNSKNFTHGSLVQRYEPGIQFPIDTFQGKIFLCTKDKDINPHIPQKLQYLGITQYQIIELLPLPLSKECNSSYSSSSPPRDIMMVHECHEMNALNKVKFKRSEVITFQFQSGLIKRYYMFDSAECVEYVKQQMTNSGISATHISKKKEYNVTTAQSLLAYVKDLEYQFCLNPSHDLVIQMVDLLREAAECLGEANDDRYQSVVSYVQNFLQRDDVIKILDQANHVNEKSSVLPPVGQIPHQPNPIESQPSDSYDILSPSLPNEQEDPQIPTDNHSPYEIIQSESIISTQSWPLLDQSCPLPSAEENEYEEIIPPSLLNQLSEESDDEDSDWEESNKYLQLEPLNHALVDPSQIWNEGVSILQQTLHQIDQDEQELGLILTDLDGELDEILGTPVEERKKVTLLRTESFVFNRSADSENDLIITFEEYDTFLESLNEKGEVIV